MDILHLVDRLEELINHLGLGTESTIKTLEIRWPSGTIQTLENVKADQVMTIAEPERK